jgi:phospholipid/cholesterol/gamma-HCH transport system ATP-binding protein
MQPQSSQAIVQVRGLHTAFGAQVVHDALDLDIYPSEILGIVGGSGSGKSVLMRAIIGLQPYEQGEVKIFNEDPRILDAAGQKALRRRWGVLFQNGALFSSLTVAENIQVPLREYFDMEQALLDEIAALKIGLAGLPREAGNKFPAQLSGGMRKRAGLARAMALDPDILFLDEPTAGLDPIGAAAFDELVKGLRAALGITFVIITHDLDTLYSICDRVAVLADKHVVINAPLAQVVDFPHSWVQEYFKGPRARAALASTAHASNAGQL